MIYLELTQDTNTAYVSLGGIIKNNKWYDDALLNIDSMSYIKSGGYIKTSDCRLVIKKDIIQNAGIDINNRVYDCKMWLAKNDVLLFSGKAILIDDDEISITILLKSKEYDVDLLDPAPDLNDLTNRNYYRAFGQGKFVEPLLLDDVNLKYHSAYGTVQAVYDDGVSVGFTDNGDGTFTLSVNPVGTITMDVNDTDSDIIQVAQFVVDRLSLTLDSTLATATKINYFVNSQINSIQFLSNVCEYANHIAFIDSANNVLKLIQLFKQFSDIPANQKITIDSFQVLRDGLGKEYNDITKQFKATWQKRASVQNPQRVEKSDANISVATGDEVGQVMEIKPYDYFDDNIQQVLQDKVNLYQLHQVQVKLGDLVLFPQDIGKALIIDVPEYCDTSKNNWCQIVNLTLDFMNAETIVRGQGELYWA